jgi:hypothetical protein
MISATFPYGAMCGIWKSIWKVHIEDLSMECVKNHSESLYRDHVKRGSGRLWRLLRENICGNGLRDPKSAQTEERCIVSVGPCGLSVQRHVWQKSGKTYGVSILRYRTCYTYWAIEVQ